MVSTWHRPTTDLFGIKHHRSSPATWPPSRGMWPRLFASVKRTTGEISKESKCVPRRKLTNEIAQAFSPLPTVVGCYSKNLSCS